MLKREIKYTNYDDEEVTEVFYFNISTTDVVEMEVEHDEGLSDWLKAIVAAENKKALFDEFKKIILMAYGEKSEDGKRFVKNDEVRENFSHTAAFDALITEFITDEGKAAEFIIHVLPKGMEGALTKAVEESTSGMAPMPPTPPQA